MNKLDQFIEILEKLEGTAKKKKAHWVPEAEKATRESKELRGQIHRSLIAIYRKCV
jgi:hypothetical protein|tara:strand:- start:25 stop:192 length:168 start_codon:yes stop_codon:yes gene_type:complete